MEERCAVMSEIVVRHRPSQFVQVPNEFIRNRNLRRGSKALLIEMMSHADGYVISETALVASGCEGRDAVRTSLKELQDHGYIQREMVTTGKGRFAGARFHASFHPEDFLDKDPEGPDGSTESDFPSTDGAPSRVFPVGKTEWENPTLKNTKEEHQEEGDSVAALPHPAPEPDGLFDLGMPDLGPGVAIHNELVKATAPTEPWDQIAKRAYDNTSGALPFMGMKVIAKWAITQKKADPGMVEQIIAQLYRAGRAVTKVIVGQAIDGYILANGSTLTASQKREQNNFSLIQWAQEQDRKIGEMGMIGASQ